MGAAREPRGFEHHQGSGGVGVVGGDGILQGSGHRRARGQVHDRVDALRTASEHSSVSGHGADDELDVGHAVEVLATAGREIVQGHHPSDPGVVRSARQRLAPMKPAPPVTSTSISELIQWS